MEKVTRWVLQQYSSNHTANQQTLELLLKLPNGFQCELWFNQGLGTLNVSKHLQERLHNEEDIHDPISLSQILTSLPPDK